MLIEELNSHFAKPVWLVPRTWSANDGGCFGIEKDWNLVEKKATVDVDVWFIVDGNGGLWELEDWHDKNVKEFARIHIKQTVVEGQTE